MKTLSYPMKLAAFIHNCHMSFTTSTLQHYEVEFSGSSGHIKKISNLVSKVSADINQQFFWYNSSSGNNQDSSQVNTLPHLTIACLFICLLSICSVLVHIYSVPITLMCSLLILKTMMLK